MFLANNIVLFANIEYKTWEGELHIFNSAWQKEKFSNLLTEFEMN